MASSIYFGGSHRANGSGRMSNGLSNGLPSYSSAVQEKLHRHAHSPLEGWIVPITLPIPGVKTRRLRVLVPNVSLIHQFSISKLGRRRGPAVLYACMLAFVFTFFAFAKRFGTEQKQWPSMNQGEPPTLVFQREDLQRIWKWEIQSGHYPSGESCMLQSLLRCYGGLIVYSIRSAGANWSHHSPR